MNIVVGIGLLALVMLVMLAMLWMAALAQFQYNDRQELVKFRNDHHRM
jgi:hypothetical protein